MNRLNFQDQLNALLDGELLPGELVGVTARLASRPGSSKILAELARLRADLAVAIPLKAPSAGLVERVEAGLASEAAGAGAANVVSFDVRSSRKRLGWIGVGGAIAAMLVVSFLPRADETRDLMSVHDAAMRASLVREPVAQNAAPVVPGFELVSAATDIVSGRRSTVYVYKAEGGKITLCIWPSDGEAARGVVQAEYQDVQIDYWNDGRAEFWAESAHPEGAALNEFVRAINPA
jgi:anti-sigma factor RsiW